MHQPRRRTRRQWRKCAAASPSRVELASFAMSFDDDEKLSVGPRYPTLVILFGATGDLAKRKLLPGLFHLASSGFIPSYRIVGVSLDELDAEGFRKLARAALAEFAQRPVTEEAWTAFAACL